MLAELGVQAPAFGDPGIGILAGALDQHHEFALALVGVGRDPRGKLGQGPVQHGLEQLGHLARQHRRTVVPEGHGHVGQCLLDAVGGFVEGERARLGRQLLQALAAGQIAAFVERHPTIKILALAFLVMIGGNLIVEGFGYHVPKGYTYFAMAFSVAVEMLNIKLRAKSRAPVHPHGPEGSGAAGTAGTVPQ